MKLAKDASLSTFIEIYKGQMICIEELREIYNIPTLNYQDIVDKIQDK